MQVIGLTHTGQERFRNEDSCLALYGEGFALLAVADGMGGHQAGDVASALAVSTLERFWNGLDLSSPPSSDRLADLVHRLMLEANSLVFAESSSDVSRQGMGTTLTMGILSGGKLVVGHVGDSRAYLIRDGEITLLTVDHSLLEQMIQQGRITPEEAQGHPQRHILTRALGTNPQVEFDITEHALEEGAILLFCTDGLTSLVNDEEILELITKQGDDPDQAAASLIEAANERGGYDNITVVLATDIGRQVV